MLSVVMPSNGWWSSEKKPEFDGLQYLCCNNYAWPKNVYQNSLSHSSSLKELFYSVPFLCIQFSSLVLKGLHFRLHLFLLMKWNCSHSWVVSRVTQDCRLRSGSCSPVLSILCAAICGSSTCGYLSGFISVRKSKAVSLLCYVSMSSQLFQYMHVPFCYLSRLTFCLSFFSFMICSMTFSLFTMFPFNGIFFSVTNFSKWLTRGMYLLILLLMVVSAQFIA